MSGADGRDQHARDDAAVARAERQRRLDQIAPHAGDRDRHHQDDLEHRADEDDEQLLQLADARPQDQQRNEGGGRQVARERDERLEERLDRLVGAHQDAERHRDQRRQHEAADHAPDRDADVVEEAVLGQQQPAFLDHGERIGEEGLGHVAAERGEAPGRDEQNEEQDAERDAGGVRDRREGLHAAAMRSVQIIRLGNSCRHSAPDATVQSGRDRSPPDRGRRSLTQRSPRRTNPASLNEARVGELRRDPGSA